MNISIWFYLQKKRRGNKPETTENTSLCGGVWVGRLEESIHGNKNFVRRHFIRVMTFEPCKYLTYPSTSPHSVLSAASGCLRSRIRQTHFVNMILKARLLCPFQGHHRLWIYYYVLSSSRCTLLRKAGSYLQASRSLQPGKSLPGLVVKANVGAYYWAVGSILENSENKKISCLQAPPSVQME